MNFPFDRKFVKFVLVGVVNSLFSYALYSLFLYLDVHYAIAATMASGLGVLFNFKTIGLIVFANRNNLLIFRFFSVYILTWVLTIGLLGLCARSGINLYFAGFAIALPMAAFSFFMQSRFVFIEKLS